jgi:hypothetical protein
MPHVRYIDKTRDYYLAQGYEKPYVWAHFDDVPFSPLAKPLAESRVALVSTSEIGFKDVEHQDPTHEGRIGSVYSIPADTPVERLCSHARAYDRYATTLEDVDAFFPITRLHEMAAAGRIGEVAPSCHGVYNMYSQRRTSEVDAPEVLRRCQDEAVDVVVLTPV